MSEVERIRIIGRLLARLFVLRTRGEITQPRFHRLCKCVLSEFREG